MSDKLSYDEMIADMGITITEADYDKLKTKETGSQVNADTLERLNLLGMAAQANKVKDKIKGKTFHNRQFTLVSCAYFRIYLQSVLPIDDIDPEDIGAFLNLAVAGNIGYKGPKNPQLEEFMRVTINEKEYLNFYTNKEWHGQWLNRAQELGLTLDINKLANKKRVLATINEYLEALADHLSIYGFTSATDYLEKHPKRIRKEKAESVDIQAIWDQF